MNKSLICPHFLNTCFRVVNQEKKSPYSLNYILSEHSYFINKSISSSIPVKISGGVAGDAVNSPQHNEIKVKQ